jgi:magnesium-transporting ATPase (P-type)
MLEAAVVLEIVLGKFTEGAVIVVLLFFNAALGFFQEGRAQATLKALKSRLALNATVRRDGVWKTLLASEIVPGDVVKLSVGAVVAADVKLTQGNILVDQSMLTGESLPIEAGPGLQTYAGFCSLNARQEPCFTRFTQGDSLFSFGCAQINEKEFVRKREDRSHHKKIFWKITS